MKRTLAFLAIVMFPLLQGCGDDTVKPQPPPPPKPIYTSDSITITPSGVNVRVLVDSQIVGNDPIFALRRAAADLTRLADDLEAKPKGPAEIVPVKNSSPIPE